jgi:uncharacterized Zn finger protein
MTRPAGTESRPNRITEETIRDYVDPASFARGLEYHRQDRIFQARVEGGRRLTAQCEGSSGGPYQVAATVEEGQIAEADCTCPMGGFCKHIVALLLAWKDHPETFTESAGSNSTGVE